MIPRRSSLVRCSGDWSVLPITCKARSGGCSMRVTINRRARDGGYLAGIEECESLRGVRCPLLSKTAFL